MKGWLGSLDRYWFGRGSPVSLGLIRIVIGFLALVNFLMIAIDFDSWFTEDGYVPQALAVRKMPPLSPNTTIFGYTFTLKDFSGQPMPVPRINVLEGVTDTKVTAAVYVVTVLAALFTMLGLWTRLSTVILAIGTVSFHHRNGFILHGGDAVLRLMILYLAMAPCGVACSLDRLIGLWKGKLTRELPMVSLWAQRLMAYQIALVYFTTFWHKMNGTAWRDGTATWYPARLREFERFPVPSFINDRPFIYLSTYGTLLVELALGTLVFYRPLRKWVLIAGLGMHAFIEYSMNVPMFAFVICSGYLAFYEGSEVSEWAKRLGERIRRFRSRVILPKGMALRSGPSEVLGTLDVFNLTSYESGEGDWEGRNARDEKIPATRASWTRAPGAWPVGWIPGVWRRVLNAAIEPASSASPEPKREPKRKAVAK